VDASRLRVKTTCMKRKPKPKEKKAEYTPPEEQSVSLQQKREAAAKCHELKLLLMQCTGGYEIRKTQNEFGTVVKEVEYY